MSFPCLVLLARVQSYTGNIFVRRSPVSDAKVIVARQFCVILEGCLFRLYVYLRYALYVCMLVHFFPSLTEKKYSV